MKSKKNFKKKQINYRKDHDEIRIKERRKVPKKISQQHLRAMMDEEEEMVHVNLYRDEEDF